MTPAELEMAAGWARAEGWNPGLNDAATFYASDETGFLIGKLDGLPIASISAVKYGASFGFIGFYIVKPEFRGRGYGIGIWNDAMASLQGRNVGLDGVVAQQENYKKSGFKLAHRNIRFAGKSTQNQAPDKRIVEADAVDFSLLEAYDRPFFPESRSVFLKNWINAGQTRTLVLLEQSEIRGYGCIRACHTGYKIGPLYAETGSLALALFSALSNLAPEGSDIFLDVPEPNPGALDLARQAGMQPSFETARMYTGEFPPLPLGKIFGITSFELG